MIFLTPISYIGATFAMVFSLLITTELINLNYLSFVKEIGLENNSYKFYFIDYFLGFLILNSFVACFYKIPLFFDKINRYTLGLFPFNVYTEIHIYGIRVFKISGFYNSKLVHNNLFKVYNEQGRVGPEYFLKPSIMFGLTYRIADICERRLGKNSTQNDEKILISLFKNTIDLNKKKINDTDVLKLYVKTINPNNETNDPNNWIDKDWSEIAQYNISKENSFNWTGLPSIANKIFRK